MIGDELPSWRRDVQECLNGAEKALEDGEVPGDALKGPQVGLKGPLAVQYAHAYAAIANVHATVELVQQVEALVGEVRELRLAADLTEPQRRRGLRELLWRVTGLPITRDHP